ncbi:band 4.1-like protein 4 [Actinia tenebrosa]|uniref:Erythrocyte membrane protein band 4.1-like 4A n=1 Tax=Actinia tenebrosa TaxID=6105 RepID=A0A6P8J250_ACTTE|nr:band 4.1-like protein 4 [Actinia tenebrosa]
MACFGRREAEFYCHVILLDESEFPVTIQKSTKGQEVLEKVFDHLNLLERDYFGLRYVDKASHSRWLDPMKLVMKQLKAGPPYLLYFCVKFYASDPCNLQEELTRYFFFLQIKRDIFQGRLPCSQNLLSEVSSYALQSELGDFDPRQHTQGYVSEFRFIPKQTEELEAKIMDCHKRLTGIVPSVAEFMYLDKVKWLEMYGVDLHLAKGEDDIEYFVALKPAGVIVYNNKTPVGTYLWPKITKIDFKGKKFSLNVSGKEGREYVYIFYLPNKSACKHLWKCCVEHHSFFRLDKVKPPVRRSSFSGLLRTGSGFRYSGRTQKEALEEGKRTKRSSPVVQRKPSKRYNRRESQSSERGHPCAAPVHARNGLEKMQGNISPLANPDTNLQTNLQYQDMTDSARGPGLPWEELAQTQAGLYTPAPESPRSVRSSGSTGKVRRRSPKFPSPHRRSGQSSGSETDSPRKRSRSRSAYYSDDDVSRRRRHHKRSHRHRHTHSADSGSDTGSLPRNRNPRKKHREPISMEEVVKLGDAAPYHWDERGSERRHRHHRGNYHSDVRSDGSSVQRPQSRVYSDYDRVSQTDRMVPALDVIQPRIALTREAKELRHRHHHHHRHSHHGNPVSESGQSTFSAPPAPPTKFLADLGPEGMFTTQRTGGQPVSRMVKSSSIVNAPLYSSVQRSFGSHQEVNGPTVTPSDAFFGNTVVQYPFVEANGKLPHSRNHGSRMDYVEVVSGPPPHQQFNMYRGYHKPMQQHPSGKSTFL